MHLPPGPAAHPTDETPPQTARLRAQSRLQRLRFLGYAGVQLNALLVPLLVFQLSGSATLAGLALLVEWLPKLALYLSGGSLVARFGRPGMHLGLEALRMGALLGLAASALGLGSVWLVAVCAAAYQCSNAVSNILFETAVTQWWLDADRPLGHTRLLRADQLGCLLGLCAGFTLRNPVYLALAGVALQGFLVLAVTRVRRELHPVSKGPSHRPSLRAQLAADMRAAARRPLLAFALSSALLGVPAALTFSALAFLLDQAQPGAASEALWMSVVLGMRTVLSLVTLHGVQAALKVAGMERKLAVAGLVVLLGTAFATAARLPLVPLLVVVAIMGAASCLYLPLVRHFRQALIEGQVPPRSRAGVTGILISVEACAYLIAALCMSTLGQNLALMSLLAALCALVGAVLLPWRATHRH